MPTTRFLPHTLHRSRTRIRARLLRWYEREGRSFPWRIADRQRRPAPGRRVRDPYMILVAEVMLQQTQTGRVTEKLPEFLERFPDVGALAAATRGALIRAWQGMGYNNRVLRLQEAARAIQQQHRGRFPRSAAALAGLPGIGPYTANAVVCFAFAGEVAVIDVNVIRVLSRLFFKCHTDGMALPAPTIERVAAAMVPSGDAYRWHQALMDLGATVCTARRPACDRCPLAGDCLSAYPPALELFGAHRAAAPEPTILGEPRRLWRGRVVELLRGSRPAHSVGDIIAHLLLRDRSGNAGAHDRKALMDVVAALLREGLIVRARGAAAGDLRETDRVRLPH